MEVFENLEGTLEIKRRSWEDRMTHNGKKRVTSWFLVHALCHYQGNSTCTKNNSNYSFRILTDLQPAWSLGKILATNQTPLPIPAQISNLR